MKKRLPTLKQVYTERHQKYLLKMASAIETDISQNIGHYPRIDLIRARAKSIERFCKKASKKVDGNKKYNDPLNQIQDQLGARIVTHYLTDVPKIAKLIEKYYRPVEKQSIVPDSENKFGYEGQHYVLFLPLSILPSMKGGNFPIFFELQITTLFQHAWSEAEHDLNYKNSTLLSTDQRRKIAFTAAQAWGADNIFNELVSKPKKNLD